MRKAFNMAACAVGGLITGFTAAVFGSGFLGCGNDTIGACINPAALSHTPVGLAVTAAVAAVGIGMFKYGYNHLSVKP